jgi:hypothetical protein
MQMSPKSAQIHITINPIAFFVCFYPVCAMLHGHKAIIYEERKIMSNGDLK